MAGPGGAATPGRVVAGAPKSVFDDVPILVLRLCAIVYASIGTVGSWAVWELTPAPRRLRAVAITSACAVAGFSYFAFRLAYRPTLPSNALFHVFVSVVPYIAFLTAVVAASPLSLGIIAAYPVPMAIAGVLFDPSVTVSAWASSVLAVFFTSWAEGGTLKAAIFCTTADAVALAVVAWITAGKSVRHREIQAELQASREVTVAAFEASVDAIYLSDSSTGRILEANKGFERLFGLRREDVVGKWTWQMLWTDDEQRDAYETALTISGGHVSSFRAEHHRRGAGPFWGESSSTALDLQRGKVILTTTRDITAQASYEAMLLQAKQLAEASARAKSEFVSNISHEVRTPINGVLGGMTLLLDTDLSDEQRRLGETVRSSAESLLGLVNDVLDLSKVEAGKVELEHLDFDLAAVAGELAAAFAPRAQAKGLEFSVLLAPGTPRSLNGDPGRLRQVLANLCSNAVKFTERGRIAVRVSAASPPAAGARTVLIRFEVRDTGIGVPPAARPGLFRKFHQADTSVTRRYGGSGLGLAISRELAVLFGGEIGVDSEVGAGSTFWFTARMGLGEAQGAEPEGRGAAVVLETEADQLEAIQAELSRLGMAVLPASGPEEAAALASRADVRLVLAEDREPTRLGMQLVGRLSFAGSGKDPPLVALVRPVALQEKAPSLADGRPARTLFRPARPLDLRSCVASLAGPAGGGRPNGSLPRNKSYEPDPLLAEARVLVVEDNPVNQQVALGLLKKMGIRARAVSNGREAVDAVAEAEFDLVLMDVQMPVMDGIEATRVIRQLPSPSARRVPIIAMTAHALQSDRLACLEAGMSAYLTKPITFPRLREAVENWVLRGGGEDGEVRRLGSTDTDVTVADLADRVAVAEVVGDAGSLEGLRRRV